MLVFFMNPVYNKYIVKLTIFVGETASISLFFTEATFHKIDETTGETISNYLGFNKAIQVVYSAPLIKG